MKEINGILPLFKPVGPTSHDMVSQLRKKLNIKKIGHSGTLDPFAKGVLVMGVGQGTRILEFMKDEKKEYIMRFRLGLMTDTYDIEGAVVCDEEVFVSEQSIMEAVKDMKGVQKQVPPIYSARKYKGKKLYEYAREGKIIKMPPRDIEIYDIEILDIDKRDVTLKAVVSPGTYMRSLAYDIGLKLDTVACAVELTRTANGQFKIDDCLRIEEFTTDNVSEICEKYIRDLNESLSQLSSVKVKPDFLNAVLNGNPIRIEWIDQYGEFKKDDLIRVLTSSDELIALGVSERHSAFYKTLQAHERNEIIVRAKKVFGVSGKNE